MEKWQDDKEFILFPLNWHGDDDDDQVDGVNDNDDTEDDDTGDGTGESGKTKKTASKKKSKKSDIPDDDSDISDDIPDDVDSLSAAELRDLLKVQGKELKKARTTSRKRLREIMEKKEKFKAIEDEKEKARIEELKQKEKYKEALEEIVPKYELLKKNVAKTHEHFEKRLDKLIDNLSDEYQGLVPDGLDIRSKIAWIENFNETVVKKAKASTTDTSTDPPPKKKKADTSVGNKGNPPEDTETDDKKGTRETMEAAINNCKSPDELERLLNGFASQGIKNM